MGKLLVVLLGLGVVLGGAYYYVTSRPEAAAAAQGQPPPRPLQHARDAAERIEQDAQRRADDLLKRGE